MYLVLSALTSSPFSLVAATKALYNTGKMNPSELSNYVSVLKERVFLFWSRALKLKHNGLILKSITPLFRTVNITLTNSTELGSRLAHELCTYSFPLVQPDDDISGRNMLK